MLHILCQQDPASAPQGAPQGPGFLVQIFPFILIFFVMWFLVIRPQRKQEKERKARVDAIKRGDRVHTRGGIVAPVVRVKDDAVVVGLGGDRSVEVEVGKAYIDDVSSADGGHKGDGK